MVLEKFNMQDRVVTITGGAGLLGIQHAKSILDAGGKVLLLDVNEAALRKAHSELGSPNIKTFTCNITKEAEVREASKYCESQFKKSADVLINNAAIDPKITSNDQNKNFSRLENFSYDQWKLELSVGLTGSFICSKVFGQKMASKKNGVIVNVASDLGIVAPDQRIYRKEGVAEHLQNVKPVTYSVIKHGLIGLTRYLATYWAQQGVRCNAFAPGGVFNNHPQEFVVKLANLIPMNRMANLDEYQASILFLASDASSFMNGAVLVCDGGRSTW